MNLNSNQYNFLLAQLPPSPSLYPGLFAVNLDFINPIRSNWKKEWWIINNLVAILASKMQTLQTYQQLSTLIQHTGATFSVSCTTAVKHTQPMVSPPPGGSSGSVQPGLLHHLSFPRQVSAKDSTLIRNDEDSAINNDLHAQLCPGEPPTHTPEGIHNTRSCANGPGKDSIKAYAMKNSGEVLCRGEC